MLDWTESTVSVDCFDGCAPLFTDFSVLGLLKLPGLPLRRHQLVVFSPFPLLVIIIRTLTA
jgi:hypothetical protein